MAASKLAAQIGNHEHTILCETKTFQQTRERTFLRWESESYPCRMKMKEAGWFIVRNKNGDLVGVCLYCKKGYKGWNRQHDPYKVHRILSPECVFVLHAHAIQTPSSPIIESMPRREQVRPSSHEMAILPERTNSFEHWPHESPHPPFEILAESGFFYIRQGTWIECFSCYGRISISRTDDNPLSAHTDQCEYAEHLRAQSQRAPLDIQASDKVYELLDRTVNNNITFYFLKCISASTPGILLSIIISLPNEQEFEPSDRNFKQLRPSQLLEQKVNWVTSSDGPLVNILKDLANNPTDLRTIPDDLRYSIEESSLLPINTTNNPVFQCKTCLNYDASPHIVSIKCCHIGLCSRECYSKWMTCVICGYTLGKAIRIYNV